MKAIDRGEPHIDISRPIQLKDSRPSMLKSPQVSALSDRVLTALSTESRVWMVTWHFNGGYTILYAAGGEIRARMRDFLFTEHVVEEGDPRILAGFRAMLDGLDPEDYRGRRGAPFAFIEAATGMRLDSELPEVEDAPVVILDNPAA